MTPGEDPSRGVSSFPHEIPHKRSQRSSQCSASVVSRMTVESGGSLNSAQQRRLRITCEYVDKLLTDIENGLHSADSKSPFPKYIADLSPLQQKIVQDYIARIRARLVSALAGQNIDREPPSVPLSRSVHVGATFMDIAVEELRPKYMRGYGEVAPEAESELNGIVGELAGLIAKLDQTVTDSASGDLAQRLKKLEDAGEQQDLLEVLERIISEHGLVEFRSTLAMIIDRLEDNRFEIAVFGRVSSGKSSLLNHILGSPVLPVGVTPITAVPIRILYGDSAEVEVWRANMPMEVVPVAQLAEFVSERFNPGNRKRVARINVFLSAARLSDGVMFVDTPGLGSLATHGAQETMAYMPRCDLGVVLVDAGATLSQSDLETIRALYELGTPSQVLLSKADLLTVEDRHSMLVYIKEQLKKELGLDLPVRPVSALPEHIALLDAWFDEDIAPLFARRMELKNLSLRRKVGALRNSVSASLNLAIRRSSAESIAGTVGSDIEAGLRQATAAIEQLEAKLLKSSERLPESSRELLEFAARQLVESWESNDKTNASGVITSAIQSQLVKHADSIQAEISSTEKYIVEILRSSAISLGFDAPEQSEFTVLAREMPAFDLGPLKADISRPLSLLASEKFAIHQVAAKLNKDFEPRLSMALRTYSVLLRDWLQALMGQIRKTFQSHADMYRAQVDRQRGKEHMPAAELDAIRKDLDLLREPVVETTH